MIERECFPLTNQLGLNEGDIVSVVSRGRTKVAEGVITQIWLGQEEMVDVATAEGKVTCCPALGDVFTVIQPESFR